MITVSQSKLIARGQKSFFFFFKNLRSLQQLHAKSRQSSQGCRHSVELMSTKKKADER
jgi:hypothetical protein